MYKDRINIKNKVETSDILTSKQGYLQLARAEKFQITHILNFLSHFPHLQDKRVGIQNDISVIL